VRSAQDVEDAELAAIVAELACRQAQSEALRGELFDKQLDLYDDPARWKAAHPGRRSGKSEYIPRGALLDLLNANDGDDIVIGAETQKKAKALHWQRLLRAARRAGIRLQGNRTEGWMRSEWGATIWFWGIKDQGAVELIRGFKLRSAYFDECATYAPLLKYLVEDVVMPALEDTGGSLTLCGTPSITRAGHWFEICDGAEKRNWSVHHWDMEANLRFPRDAAKVMAAAALRYQHTDKTPSATFLREYKGLFVNDPSMQVYRYSRTMDRSVLPATIEEMRRSWHFVLGVDFGFNEECAWSVLAWHPHSRELWVLESFKLLHLDVDQAAEQTAQLCAKYGLFYVVGDTGGLGKPYAVQWNRRYAGKTYEHEGQKVVLPPMEPADKREKLAHIKVLNTELTAGRLLVYAPACQELSGEILVLPWADPRREKEHPGYANHCADSTLYAFTKATAYLSGAPEQRPDAAKDPAGHERWQELQELEEMRGRSQGDDLESYRSAWTRLCASFGRCARWARSTCASALTAPWASPSLAPS
jgi:hypothetical protein